MKRSESDLVGLLGDIYAAGLGDRRWPESLQSLADFFGAAASFTVDYERTTGQRALRYVYGLEQIEREYDERYHAINPRARQPLEYPGPHTSYDYDKISEEEMRRHEFYDWFERAAGVRYYVGSRTIDGDQLITYTTVEFTRRHGHATPDEIKTFKLLTPHLANAWRTWRTIGQLAVAKDAFSTLQEAVQWGVVGLDGQGRVSTMNGRARAIVARADGVKMERGYLCLQRAAEDRTLKLIIAHTLRAVRGESLYPGGALAVPRCNGHLPYAVRVTPTRCGAELVPGAAPIVLVIIADPDVRGVPRREELMAVFRLSERECELVQHLMGGLALEEAAGRMNIARNTARNHLATVFDKTGARTQADLSGLLSSLPSEAPTI